MCKAADRLSLGALALVAVLAWSAIGFGQPPPADAVTRTLGRNDDGLRRLFTPATFPPGTFTVHRSDERIERLAARLRALDPAPVAGAWRVDGAGVFDAFGAEGPYDKPRLARLFGGSSPSVARGTLVTATGRLAFTLLSPCPDQSLSSLRPGTMVIATKLPSRESSLDGLAAADAKRGKVPGRRPRVD